MNPWKIVLWSVLAITMLIGLSYALGYNDVLYTRTVGKAKQNANREVFEETQSYVEGKRQEAAKLYKEYKLADTQEDKQVIENVVAQSFANFDEENLSGPIYTFVYRCKYGAPENNTY